VGSHGNNQELLTHRMGEAVMEYSQRGAELSEPATDDAQAHESEYMTGRTADAGPPPMSPDPLTQSGKALSILAGIKSFLTSITGIVTALTALTVGATAVVVVHVTATPSASPQSHPMARPASGPARLAAAPSAGPTSPSGPATVSLVNLTPASGAFQSSDTNPVVNGQSQILAVTEAMGGYTTSGDTEYDLGRDYTQFSALLGIDDNSPLATLDPMPLTLS
jgi:hypothetical protein